MLRQDGEMDGDGRAGMGIDKMCLIIYILEQLTVYDRAQNQLTNRFAAIFCCIFMILCIALC